MRTINLKELFDALGALGSMKPADASKRANVCSPSRTPAPVRAVFGLNVEDGKLAGEKPEGGEAGGRKAPTLTTKVWFDDGSWTVVKNSPEDPVETTETKASDGSEVEVATDASKERALVFAMAKRLFGKVDPRTKEVRCPDYAGRFRKVLKASVDRGLEKAEKAVRKRAEAAKAENGPAYVTKADLENFAKTLASEIAEAIAKKAGEGPAKEPTGA